MMADLMQDGNFPLFVGAGLFLLVLAVGLLATGGKKRGRAYEVVQGAPKSAKKARSNQPSATNQMERKLKQLEKQTRDDQPARTMAEKLQEAGWSMQPKRFWIISAISAVAGLVLARLAGAPPLILVSSVALAGLGLPHAVLAIARARRRSAFLGDMADALDAITRAIKAGLPVSEAMAIIGRDYEGAIGEEFSRAVDEQRLGIPMAESLERVARRMPLAEVRMLSMAVAIQTQTGGSLAETLENLSAVIRGRERLRRKVKAVSSEAKISALIMGSLPLFVMGSLWLINPDYVNLLFVTRVGQVLMVGCGIWMSMGVFVMWKMVNFKV